MAEGRLLLGILVYNGEDVVPPCLESAAHLVGPGTDVVVFDDCSPAVGWSERVAEQCAALGIGYYRAPRNIGIPRNMNLVLGHGLEANYEFVGLVNSDVILPRNLPAVVRRVFDDDPTLATATLWSNNVSAFSLPFDGAGPQLRDQSTVDLLSDTLFELYGGRTLDVPTGVGYCMVMPRRTIIDVGLMDPIFGRGYCEEVDWCQRAIIAGYRHGLALGGFAYHHGSVSTREAGLLAHGHTTIPAHEAIISMRYPDYHDRVRAFLHDPGLGLERDHAMPLLAAAVCRAEGYELRISSIDGADGGHRVTLDPHDPNAPAKVQIYDVTVRVDRGPWTPETTYETFGRPRSTIVSDHGRTAVSFFADARTDATARISTPYPSRV